MPPLRYLLVSEKNNELFPLQATITVIITFSQRWFRHSFRIRVQPLSGSRTIIARYSFLVIGYNSVQKHNFARRADFQRRYFRSSVDWRATYSSNFFASLVYARMSETVSLETHVRETASVLPFDSSSFNVDLDLPRGLFSRFSIPEPNF